ncbi:unnamed protein product, partial [Discosporangium mesarthrocarpum]
QAPLLQAGLKLVAADRGEFEDLEGMDLKAKLQLLKRNEDWKCMVKWEVLK